MNLLKKVIISGEMNSMYASVSFKYIFTNSGKDMTNSFYMPVPYNGCITGFSVLDKEKRLVKGTITGRSDVENDCAAELTMTGDGLCCFEWDEASDTDEYIFCIDMIVRMCPRNKTMRLHIPLGIRIPGASPEKSNSCTFEMNLYTRMKNINIKSSAYPVDTTNFENETLFSVRGNMGKDLMVDFNVDENKSFGTVGEYMSEGTGLYRIYSNDRKSYITPKKKIIFLLDLTGIIADGKRKAVKETLLRSIREIPEELSIQVLTTDLEKLKLLDEFTPCTAQIQEEVYDKIYGVSHIDNSFLKMFEEAEKSASHDTEVILVSGGDGLRKKESILKSKMQRAHIFTVGDFGELNFAKSWKRNFRGIHEHFYLKDLMDERYAEAIRRVLESGCDIQIQAEDSAVREMIILKGTDIAADGYVDIAVKYTGVRPRTFSVLKSNGEMELVRVADIDSYQTLPDAERIFGAEKTDYLYGLLERTSPVSVRNIKRELEITGKESGILNSETVICLDGKRREKAIVHRMYSSAAKGIYEFANRPSVFRQNGEPDIDEKDKQRIIKSCIEFLLYNIRSDGALSDRFSEDERVEDSVYSLAAFMLVKDGGISSVTADIMEYLKGKEIRKSAEILYKNIQDIEGFLRKHGEVFFEKTLSTEELLKVRNVKSCSTAIIKLKGERV